MLATLNRCLCLYLKVFNHSDLCGEQNLKLEGQEGMWSLISWRRCVTGICRFSCKTNRAPKFDACSAVPSDSKLTPTRKFSSFSSLTNKYGRKCNVHIIKHESVLWRYTELIVCKHNCNQFLWFTHISVFGMQTILSLECTYIFHVHSK